MKRRTWNGSSQRNKEEQIVEEMIKTGYRRYCLLWSEVQENEGAKERVGLIIPPDRLINVVKADYLNEKILGVKKKLKDKEMDINNK